MAKPGIRCVPSYINCNYAQCILTAYFFTAIGVARGSFTVYQESSNESRTSFASFIFVVTSLFQSIGCFSTPKIYLSSHDKQSISFFFRND